MQAKSVLYAAVGAPVVVAKKVGEKAEALKGKVSEQRTSYGEAAERTIDGWATEGQKVVTRISEGRVVEEISSKVDLDQAKEQVGKLRDQLEDMLATWRTSFRPEKAGEDAEDTAEVDETVAGEPAAKTSPSKSTSTKKPVAKTTQTSGSAKTSSAKSPSTSAGKAN